VNWSEQNKVKQQKMTFESDDRFLSMATSAVCGTALAAAMFYFLRDAIRQYEDEDRPAGGAKSIADICNNPDLSTAKASIRISENSSN
jgi:chromosome condensin MukBEF ATPase and DNA-binding subunit MukB